MQLLQSALAECVGGCAGGICKAAAMYPLDLATTRREVGLSAFEESPSLMDRGYRGLGICVALAPFYALLFHSAYVVVASRSGDLVGSAVGSIAASVVGVPSECVKKRVQLGSTRRAAARSGLFDGYAATLLRNVPYNAVNFCVFRSLRRAALPASLAGFIAGAATAVVTHPLDVALTQIQTARYRTKTKPESLLLALMRLFRDGTFFRGLIVRLLAYAPASLIFFAVFDPIRHYTLALLT